MKSAEQNHGAAVEPDGEGQKAAQDEAQLRRGLRTTCTLADGFCTSLGDYRPTPWALDSAGVDQVSRTGVRSSLGEILSSLSRADAPGDPRYELEEGRQRFACDPAAPDLRRAFEPLDPCGHDPSAVWTE